MFFLYQNIALFLYACFKAFLPLPSLEVVLLPLCLKIPNSWLLFCLVGSLGTMVGGLIGYLLAMKFGRCILKQLATPSDIQQGEKLMKRYGVLAVIVGGITPIPDFLLAYLAGLMKMPIMQFLLSDGIARLIRSLIICFGAKEMAHVLPIDRYFNWISIGIIIYFLYRWIKSKLLVSHACKK